MLKNAISIGNIGADTAENEQHVAEIAHVGEGSAGHGGGGHVGHPREAPTPRPAGSHGAEWYKMINRLAKVY